MVAHVGQAEKAILMVDDNQVLHQFVQHAGLSFYLVVIRIVLGDEHHGGIIVGLCIFVGGYIEVEIGEG